MQNEYLDKFTNVGQESYSALQELGVINSKALQKLAELQLNFATMNIESGIEQARALTGTTNYKDLLTSASEFANDYGNKVIDMTRQTTEVLNDSRDEIVEWLEKGFESSIKTVKKTSKRTTKKADD